MGDSNTYVFSLSSLLCQEGELAFLNEDEAEKFDLNPSFFPDNEDEYVQNLVGRESTDFGSKSSVSSSADCSSLTKEWLNRARLDSIEWIFYTGAIFGYQFRTAYLSVTYFDRYLSKKSIGDGKLWVIRLLSVACLSLAAKMEECELRPLSEYQVEDYEFDNMMIKRMELLVLTALEWKMGSISPFAYLHYFINKFCGESRPKEIDSRAVELIVAVTKEINLMDHRPSVIAAAAVLVAIDGQLSRKELELKISVISWWGSQENGKVKTPKSVISPNLSSKHSSSISGTRKRLNFNDCDRNCPVKRIRRP